MANKLPEPAQLVEKYRITGPENASGANRNSERFAGKAFCRESLGTSDLEALRAAGKKMKSLIASAGTTDNEIVAEFKKVRRDRRKFKS